MEQAILSALENGQALVIQRQREQIEALQNELDALRLYVDELCAASPGNRDEKMFSREIPIFAIPKSERIVKFGALAAGVGLSEA